MTKIPTRIDGRAAAAFARASVVLVLSSCYFLSVFRLPQDTVLKWGLGDWIDPYFINYLLEHWYRSVLNFTDPSSPPMYFPVRGVLGYSHGLILYAPFYLVVRPFLHPFQAYSLTLFLVMEIGSVCLYLVFRKSLGLRFMESLLLTAFFVTSANVINKPSAIWSQRMSVFLIPPVLLLALVSARLPEGRPRLMLAGMSGLFFTLLFTQDFYTAQLGLLLLVLLLAGALPLAREHVRRAVVVLQQIVAMVDPGDSVRPFGRPSRWWLVVACVSLASAVAVLIHPIRRTTIGSWTFSATDATRPLALTLLTAGWFVFRWSGLASRLERAVRRVGGGLLAVVVGSAGLMAPLGDRTREFWKRDRPWILTFALGGLVGCLVFLWIYVGAYREHHIFPAEQLVSSLVPLDPSNWRNPRDFLRDFDAYETLRPFKLAFLIGTLVWVPALHVEKKSRFYGLWVMFVSVIVLLTAVRFNGFSLWKWLFSPLPGLSIIRDPRRIIHLYELAVVLMTGLFLARLPRRSVFRIGIVLLLAVLLATEWNREVFDFERSNEVYDQWVGAPIAVDGSCTSFFIKGASQKYMSRSGHMWTLYGVDAMFISLNHSIPTLNGYSAWPPEGWTLANPQEATYRKRVADWIEQHHLRGVCELDIEERTMKPYNPVRAVE